MTKATKQRIDNEENLKLNTDDYVQHAVRTSFRIGFERLHDVSEHRIPVYAHRESFGVMRATQDLFMRLMQARGFDYVPACLVVCAQPPELRVRMDARTVCSMCWHGVLYPSVSNHMRIHVFNHALVLARVPQNEPESLESCDDADMDSVIPDENVVLSELHRTKTTRKHILAVHPRFDVHWLDSAAMSQTITDMFCFFGAARTELVDATWFLDGVYGQGNSYHATAARMTMRKAEKHGMYALLTGVHQQAQREINEFYGHHQSISDGDGIS
jgi:hypothetical protein